jgi:hypothetical protein
LEGGIGKRTLRRASFDGRNSFLRTLVLSDVQDRVKNIPENVQTIARLVSIPGAAVVAVFITLLETLLEVILILVPVNI